MAPLSDNARGSLLMMASMASFTVSDACVKALGGAMPLSQILFIRSIAATSFILFLAWRLRQLKWRFGRRDTILVVFRSVTEVASAYFFLTALIHMPLANLTALLQMLPLTVTLGSAFFFRDPVGWQRWTAIAIGFCGMLLIVRPGTEGFDAWTFYALIAVVLVTFRDLAVRAMSSAVPSLTVTAAASFCVLIFSAIWSSGQDWAPITPGSAALLIGTSLFIVAAYSLSVMVMRVGEVGFVAPFRYTGLIWALVLGWFVFGDWPMPLTLIGATLIVATGIFTLWREARLRRRIAARAGRP